MKDQLSIIMGHSVHLGEKMRVTKCDFCRDQAEVAAKANS